MHKNISTVLGTATSQEIPSPTGTEKAPGTFRRQLPDAAGTRHGYPALILLDIPISFCSAAQNAVGATASVQSRAGKLPNSTCRSEGQGAWPSGRSGAVWLHSPHVRGPEVEVRTGDSQLGEPTHVGLRAIRHSMCVPTGHIWTCLRAHWLGSPDVAQIPDFCNSGKISNNILSKTL